MKRRRRRLRVKAKSRRSPCRSGDGASAAAAATATDEGSSVQALLGMDDDTIEEKLYNCLIQLNDPPPKPPNYWSEYDEPQQITELYQRLALYRIRGYELQVHRKLPELDDATLKQRHPPQVLYDEGYFYHYEGSLEWCFDDELCKHAGFEDYQRLVLNNYGEYQDWDCYKSTLHTYEEDLAYVQYCEAIENETKWVDDYLADCSIPWKRVENVACLQSLKVAAGFPNVSPNLVTEGFKEHMGSVRFDFWNYNGLDGVYFEIWKRVAKQNMDFTEALSEVHQEKMFPSRSFEIEQELERNPPGIWSMKNKYDAYVACIGASISDDEARTLITDAVIKMSPKSKVYVDYARKKLEIAEEIGLITKK
ncbi:unnamed protein product [Urochloa humidicola]